MKTSIRVQLLLCALTFSAFTFAPSASAQNLLVNGSFEDGFASWTLTPGTFSFAGNDPMFAHSGNGYANLESTGSVATLSQTFNTNPGQSNYSLSFWLANDTGVPPNSFSVMWNGTVLTGFPIVNQPQFGYTNFTFNNLTASGSTSTISFHFQHDDDFWRLDTVSVIPEPSTNALMLLSGAGLLGFMQYRRVKARRLSAEA